MPNDHRGYRAAESSSPSSTALLAIAPSGLLQGVIWLGRVVIEQPKNNVAIAVAKPGPVVLLQDATSRLNQNRNREVADALPQLGRRLLDRSLVLDCEPKVEPRVA